MLYVEQNGKKYYLRFFIMRFRVMPIMGKDIQILDCDSVHSVTESISVDNTAGISQIQSDAVLKQYEEVFTSVGKINTLYIIQSHPNVAPVIDPLRRLPVALRQTVEAELQSLDPSNQTHQMGVLKVVR